MLLRMLHVFYLLIVLLTALVSMAIGFRRGITRMLSSLLGLGFGAVAARLLSPGFYSYFLWVERFSPAAEFNEISINLVCHITIYTIVYCFFAIFSKILESAMSVFYVGIFNRLLGGFFGLVKNLLWLSFFLNLLICFKSESALLRYERANDGNPIAAVMEMTPAILGCYGGEDFAHFHQLKEAKLISSLLKSPFGPDNRPMIPKLNNFQIVILSKENYSGC